MSWINQEAEQRARTFHSSLHNHPPLERNSLCTNIRTISTFPAVRLLFEEFLFLDVWRVQQSANTKTCFPSSRKADLIFPAYLLNIVTRYTLGQDRLDFICSMSPRAISYMAYLQDFIGGMFLSLSVERRQRSKGIFHYTVNTSIFRRLAFQSILC